MKKWTNAVIEELSIEETANGKFSLTPEGCPGIVPILGWFHYNNGPIQENPDTPVETPVEQPSDDGKKGDETTENKLS